MFYYMVLYYIVNKNINVFWLALENGSVVSSWVPPLQLPSLVPSVPNVRCTAQGWHGDSAEAPFKIIQLSSTQ